MQVSAVLVAQPLVPAETNTALPAENIAWDAALALFGAEGEKDDDTEPETAVVELTDQIQVDVETVVPDPVSVEPLPALLVEQLPDQPDEPHLGVALPILDVSAPFGQPAEVQDKPHPPRTVAPTEVTFSNPLPPLPPVLADKPAPLADPEFVPAVLASRPPQPDPPPLRSRAENLWEMRGLIPTTSAADPTEPTDATAALELPDPLPALPDPADLPATIMTPSAPIDDAPHINTKMHLPLLHPGPSPRLAPEFLAMVQSQASAPPDGTITVTLSPVELGDLQLAMVRDGDLLRVAITADRPETLDLLRRHADQLGQELRDAGYASTSFSFSHGQQTPQNPEPAQPDRTEDWRNDALLPSPKPVAQPSANVALTGLDLRL